MRKGIATVFVLSWMGCAPGDASAELIRCPESVLVHQTATSTPEGWSASLEDSPPRLAGVAFYDGPVQEGASLVPDHPGDAGAKDYQAAWRFDPASKRGFWIACEYTGTRIVLSRRLTDVSVCRVRYDLEATVAGRPSVVEVSCD